MLLEQTGYHFEYHKMYWVKYAVHDLFTRLGLHFGLNGLCWAGRKVRESFENLAVRIPTNEFYMVATKE